MSNICRLWSLLWIFYKHGLFYLLRKQLKSSKTRFIFIWLPLFWPKKTKIPRGVKIRKALEEAGPIFVKFGQQLSTRLDLLPKDIGNELTLLQDNVPAFPTEQAITSIEKALQQPLTNIFTDFHDQPLASASIAQVHTACLLNKKPIIIKILRPDIKKIIYRDLNLMFACTKILLFLWPTLRQFRPLDFIAEFKHTLYNELDLRKEAANASQLKRNFANNPLLYIPIIHWSYCKKNVLVMERIHGIKATHLLELNNTHVNLKLLAERGVTLFFTQVFHDAFFHADMHAGNIFINTSQPDDPTYIAVDFGIMGTLSPNDQFYIAFNLWAFFNRDYKKVADLHIESGWLPPETRKIDFEMAIRSVCEPIFEKPLKDISFGLLFLQLLQTARQFNMRLQPQLILLQKTLLNVEGMARQLYPDLNLWETASPFLDKWIQNKLGIKALLQKIKHETPRWGSKLPEFPNLIYNALQEFPKLEKHYAEQQNTLHKIQKKLAQMQNNLPRKLLSIMLGFSGIAIMLLLSKQQHNWQHVPIQSVILFILAIIFWIK